MFCVCVCVCVSELVGVCVCVCVCVCVFLSLSRQNLLLSSCQSSAGYRLPSGGRPVNSSHWRLSSLSLGPRLAKVCVCVCVCVCVSCWGLSKSDNYRPDNASPWPPPLPSSCSDLPYRRWMVSTDSWLKTDVQTHFHFPYMRFTHTHTHTHTFSPLFGEYYMDFNLISWRPTITLN